MTAAVCVNVVKRASNREQRGKSIIRRFRLSYFRPRGFFPLMLKSPEIGDAKRMI